MSENTLERVRVTTMDDATLSAAQAAILLPEVQEMMKRLAAYNLGVFMPHMHDETGAFRALPADVVQVEEGLEVSFKSEAELAELGDRAVQIGWRWRDDGVFVGAACSTTCINMPSSGKHERRHAHTGL